LNKYRIFETDEFLKRVEKLEPQDKAFITKKLISYIYPQIKFEPFFGKNIKKLKGYVPDTWRYRIGKFRIFYTMDQQEEIIYILTIDHRKDAYR
jgi:mRNA interferase RelE/StbE